MPKPHLNIAPMTPDFAAKLGILDTSGSVEDVFVAAYKDIGLSMLEKFSAYVTKTVSSSPNMSSYICAR